MKVGPLLPLTGAALMRAALVALALFAAAPEGSAQERTQPEGTISVDESAEDDLRIARRIREILSQLDGYANVRVSVRAGIVMLTGSALDGAAIDRLDQLVARVEGVVAIENTVLESTDLAERLDPAVDRFLARLSQTVAYAPLILVAGLAGLIIASVGFLIARLRQPWERLAPNPFIADILRQIVRLVAVVSAIVVALDILGATALMGTFLGAAGIVGLAIGFAVKDTVENFVASVMLSLRQPFRPNDLVEIEGDLGHVIRLTSRATVLLSPEGNHIRIPNSTVFKARIVNFTRNDDRRFDFALGVAVDADLAQVRQIGLEALASLPFVLDTPSPAAWVDRAGDTAVEFTFAGWIDQKDTDFGLARSEAIRIVRAAISAAGFSRPATLYRVRLDPGTAVPSPETQAPERNVARTEDRPEPTPEPVPLGDSNEEALKAKVTAERLETRETDLLNPTAPEE